MHQDSKRGSARGGRGRGRGAGRGKRGRRVVSSDEEIIQGTAIEPVQPQPMDTCPEPEPVVEVENAPKIDIEADISKLEAPTFTTITRGPPEPMVRLKWTHKVLLIGEKVLNPMIHSCDTCLLPILHYGRMIPCKHVFCLGCAKREPVKECPRCKDKVCRVEQSNLGSVFMCTHGGSRYNNKGCRRTYLSQRDLQAHINHRHVTMARPNEATEKPAVTQGTPLGRKSLMGNTTPSAPAVSSVRTNLMNMQDSISEAEGGGGHFSRHSSSRYSQPSNVSGSGGGAGTNSGGGNWNNYR